LIIGNGTLFVVVAPPPNARVERAPTLIVVVVVVVFVVIESIMLAVRPSANVRFGCDKLWRSLLRDAREKHVVILRGVQRRRAMAREYLPPDDETRTVDFYIVGASRLR
jgi:hypothetical protein